MQSDIINIISHIFLCLGVFCVFWKRDILKEKASNLVITTSGFVVSIVSLFIIYIVSR